MIRPQWAAEVALPDGGSWKKLTLEEGTDRYQAELRQRPGSIIPLANLAQSTAEMRTDSLTLLVCVDNKGYALGQLYEDDGDGFSYKNGQYRVTEIEAVKKNNQLRVSLRQKEGKMQSILRKLRIGYVSGGKVKYSSWQTGEEIVVSIK